MLKAEEEKEATKENEKECAVGGKHQQRAASRKPSKESVSRRRKGGTVFNAVDRPIRLRLRTAH